MKLNAAVANILDLPESTLIEILEFFVTKNSILIEDLLSLQVETYKDLPITLLSSYILLVLQELL